MTPAEIKNLAEGPVLRLMTTVAIVEAASWVLLNSASIDVRKAAAVAIANPELEMTRFVWLEANNGTIQASYPNLVYADVKYVVDTYWPKIWE